MENPTDYIDQGRLQELNEEVSNYMDDYGQENENLNNFSQTMEFNRIKYDYDLKCKQYQELHVVNLQLKEENEKFIEKIEEYSRKNSEWEAKVNSIKNTLKDYEVKNKKLKENNDKITELAESLKFKLKLAEEKGKIKENSIQNFELLQKDFEVKTKELKNEFKIKEENLKRKGEQLEKTKSKKLEEIQLQCEERIDKLNSQLKEANRVNEEYENEIQNLKVKMQNTERFYESKEAEFQEIMDGKDRKLKELERCIKSVSEEANNQINNLVESVEDFNEKMSYYKTREKSLLEEIKRLKIKRGIDSGKNITNLSKRNILSDAEDEDEFEVPQTKKHNSINSLSSEDRKAETNINNLRAKVRELEDENLTISRELNLKYEESDTLNEEIRRCYEAISHLQRESEEAVKQKDDEITDLSNKINDLDILLQKYEQNLTQIRQAHEKSVQDNRKEITQKDRDLRFIADKYEKRIKELQRKIEHLLLQEEGEDAEMNFSNFSRSVNQSKEREREKVNYSSRAMPDDEDVRRNIDNQINYIKEKLERNLLD